MIDNIFSFLNTNSAGLTIIIAFVAGVYKFGQFVNVKRADARQRDFENFHMLVEKLVVDRKESGGVPFIDVQIASVYELRNYPRYYRVSDRILERMKSRISDKPLQSDLIKEIDEITSYMKRPWIIRNILS